MIMRRAFLSLLLAAGAVLSAPASADGALAIELNRLEQNGSACRVTFVTKNGLGAPLDELAVELVLFDKAGLVSRMTAASFGAMETGKTLVKRFDMPDLACADVARVLVNGVAACKGDGLDGKACAQGLSTTNRTGATFGR